MTACAVVYVYINCTKYTGYIGVVFSVDFFYRQTTFKFSENLLLWLLIFKSKLFFFFKHHRLFVLFVIR